MLVVDTNILSGLFNNQPAVVGLLEQVDRVVVPAVVVGELLGGYRYGTRFLQNQAVVNTFLELAIVDVAIVNEKVAELYGELYAFLRRNGTPIPQNDIWIAATAIAQGLPLLTLDTDFDYLPQVRRVAL